MELKIKVICEGLPSKESVDAHGRERMVRERIHLGIQRGEEVIAAVAADAKRVTFEPTFRVAERDGGTTNFLGPFAKGTPQERFFYLSWLTRTASGDLARYGRAKVHLSHLPWAVVSRAAAAGTPLTVRLSMRDKRGRPRCGSIRDGEAQWRL